MSTLHQTLTTINLSLSSLFVMLSFNLPERLIRFILLGEMPDGTTLLSPDTMLAITIACFVCTLLLASSALSLKYFRLIHSSTKFRLPKRRYTSL